MTERALDELDGLEAGLDGAIHRRVDDGFELSPGGGVGEDDRPELLAIDGAVGGQHVAETGADLLRRLRPGRHHTVRKRIGVETRNPAPLQRRQHVALPRRDTTSQPDLEHSY